MRRLAVLFALISTASCGHEDLNKGVAAFKDARYPQAVEFFQQAAARNPKSLKAHLYLGSSFISMWIASNGVDANALSAEKEFRRVLELDAKNDVALAGLANIVYAEAGGLSGEERNRKLDEAAGYYSRLAAVDPSNKVAPYSIGVIAWQKWYRALMTERAKLR